MELYSSGTVTAKTRQLAVSGTQSILQCTVGELFNNFSSLVSMLPADVPPEVNNKLETMNALFENSRKLFSGLETERQRLRYLKQNGLVLPQSYVIGQITVTKPDGGRVHSDATAEYVPIIDTLLLYNKKTHTYNERAGIIQGSRDKHRYNDSAYYTENPSARQLILYHDDIEVGNPLGSRAGVHKLTMFYVAVEGFSSGQLSNIHLVLVCHASDLARFGYGPVLKPLLHDLEKLSVGVKVVAADDITYSIQARVEHIAADNLAANQILGFNRSFSKGHFCRFCYADAETCACAVIEDPKLLRSSASHQQDIDRVETDASWSKRTGVRERSALDGLSYLSILDATVPDVM